MFNKEDISYTQALTFRKTDMIYKDDSKATFGEFKKADLLPPAYEIVGEGEVRFTLFLPNARKVVLRTLFASFELEKNGDTFSGVCPVGTGYIVLFVNVDGTDIIYHALPVGFGSSKPINFIEIPEKDCVILPDEVPHGSVCMDFLPSKVTGRLERVSVYLPPDYYESPDRRYPVLYLQHGHGENESTWVYHGKANFIYDNLIAAGKAVPAVVVMCNGMVHRDEGDRFVADLAEGFERFLTEEVMPFAEKKYRIIGDKEHRAMAGLSMGSMQTSVVTLKHQDLFDYAGIFSGFVADILTGYEGHITPSLLDTYSKNLKYIFRSIGDCDYFYESFLKDDELLKAHGVETDRRIYKGGAHTWTVWQHNLYDFAQMIFR
ncbi:MAG: enterochelin esterase [Lachnospiraceae bacterium]|nr:enterochelin esterase [Lachnospiraceae bacterium]